MSSCSPLPISTDQTLARLAEPVAMPLLATERLLEELVAEHDGALAFRVYHEALRAGGKRLRPLLTLLCCQACGGEAAGATQVAMVVEVLHLSSLIHDDVIDEASERRGRPSVRQRYGNRASILVGDLLVAAAFQHLARLPDLPPLAVLAGAVAQMCQAELCETPADPVLMTEDQYWAMIEGKTARLMAAACEVGALVAHADHFAAPLAAYGRNLGLAFQIVDDLLDLYGDGECLGKPVLQDLQRGSWTLPIIYALGTGARTTQLRELLLQAADSPEAARTAAELAADLGGRDYARRRAEDFVQTGLAALDDLPVTPARESLTQLARYVLQRQY